MRREELLDDWDRQKMEEAKQTLEELSDKGIELKYATEAEIEKLVLAKELVEKFSDERWSRYGKIDSKVEMLHDYIEGLEEKTNEIESLVNELEGAIKNEEKNT